MSKNNSELDMALSDAMDYLTELHTPPTCDYIIPYNYTRTIRDKVFNAVRRNKLLTTVSIIRRQRTQAFKIKNSRANSNVHLHNLHTFGYIKSSLSMSNSVMNESHENN